MTGKLGFALVGCGLVAPAHARALRELDGAELRVVCSRTEADVRRFAAEYGCQWTTSYAELLQRPDIDVVDLCTPQDTHRDLGVAAAQAGRHVVVEKPIEISVDRGRELIAACREQGQKLAVIFQSRRKKSLMVLKQAVDAGKLGRLLLGDAYVKWFRPQSYYDASAWRGTWAHEGGGALINQTSHSVDALQWIMGGVESVCAQVATTPVHQIEVDDLAVATVRFRNGALGVIEGSTALAPGMPDRIEVHGEKGTVVVEGGKIRDWQVEGMDEDEMKAMAEETSGSGAADPMAFPITWHKAQLQDMIDAIVQDREPEINGEEGLKALQVIEAIYASARCGRMVTL